MPNAANGHSILALHRTFNRRGAMPMEQCFIDTPESSEGCGGVRFALFFLSAIVSD